MAALERHRSCFEKATRKEVYLSTSTAKPSFEGKVALVAGASRGIGAVTARAFADAGAAVVIAARDGKSLDSVAKSIESAGGRVLPLTVDVGDATAVERLIQQTLNNFGRLDMAFNNA